MSPGIILTALVAISGLFSGPGITTPVKSRSTCTPLASTASYDNALAETINGLYKAELIHRRAWKTREAIELPTLEWVAWFNHHRLMEPTGYIPPAEAEANHYRQLETPVAEPALT